MLKMVSKPMFRNTVLIFLLMISVAQRAWCDTVNHDPAAKAFPFLFSKYQAFLALPMYKNTGFVQNIEQYRKQLPLRDKNDYGCSLPSLTQEELMRMVVEIHQQSDLNQWLNLQKVKKN